MCGLYNLITTIMERPEIYIGKCSIQRFYAYIGGYLHQNSNADDHCLNGFNEYIASRYGINSDHNWADIIEFFSSDGREELATFKKHFEAFIKMRERGDGSIASSDTDQ